ncbi:MAG: hypothetical protein AAGF12_17360 [Myxococcota bacterium]
MFESRDEHWATVETWLAAFQRTTAFENLPAATQTEVPVVGEIFAYCADRPLAKVGPEELRAIFDTRIPTSFGIWATESFRDALLPFLLWAAKHGRLRGPKIEYVVRELRSIPLSSFRERASVGTQLAFAAHDDGVALTDLAAIRAHAIGTARHADFVDEFLPPGPIYIGNGRVLYSPDGWFDRRQSR